MLRHPCYLEIPWDLHQHRAGTGPHRRFWRLIAGVVLLAMFVIGIGVTSGIM